MSWSERAQLYRDSEAHREGEDLDLVVEWSEGAETALDVATGGGHVARRLREAGVNVVTVDSAPGMQPDVVSRSEDIPFADESFDVVVCRVAAHHFDDVPKAVSEMARVSRDRVIVVDNLFLDDDAERADRVRDPSHVKNWSEGEWRSFFAAAGLQVDEVRRLEKPIEVEPWLERAGTSEEDAQRVRDLLGDRIQDGWIMLDRLVIRGRKKCPSRRHTPASGPRSRGARADPRRRQGFPALAPPSARSGLVLTTQKRGSVT